MFKITEPGDYMTASGAVAHIDSIGEVYCYGTVVGHEHEYRGWAIEQYNDDHPFAIVSKCFTITGGRFLPGTPGLLDIVCRVEDQMSLGIPEE